MCVLFTIMIFKIKYNVAKNNFKSKEGGNPFCSNSYAW